jgi:hypothetical protein
LSVYFLPILKLAWVGQVVPAGGLLMAIRSEPRKPLESLASAPMIRK